MTPFRKTPAEGGEGLILVAGATGFVGRRLLDDLEQAGREVRCLLRRPEMLGPRPGRRTTAVRGDVLDPSSLRDAMRGVDVAFYLVHSLRCGAAFEDVDRRGARNFAEAADEAGVRRIIYLGGLGEEGTRLSAHLASRQEVGRILREGRVPAIEFRSSIIIGSGSLPFDMVRALVDRVPVLFAPPWFRTLSQPIAIADVVAYLVAALDVNVEGSTIFEIGGADRVPYSGIMLEYARQRALTRVSISVPLLPSALCRLWLRAVEPADARVGRRLIESLRCETIVRDERGLRLFDVRPCGLSHAIERALTEDGRGQKRCEAQQQTPA